MSLHLREEISSGDDMCDRRHGGGGTANRGVAGKCMRVGVAALIELFGAALLLITNAGVETALSLFDDGMGAVLAMPVEKWAGVTLWQYNQRNAREI